MSKPFLTVRLPESEKIRFKAWLKTQSVENRVQCQNLMVKTILGIDRRAKMFVPVDKGFLKTGIHPTFTADRLGGSVYNQRDYAPYVEFGTGTKVVAPADVAEYAMTFKGRGIRKVNNIARPYLFPAVRIGQKEMFAKLEQMGFKHK
jgi:hypothetical protein